MSQNEAHYLLLFIAPLVLINAFEAIFMRVAVREKKIRALAISQVTRQLVDKCSRILFGLFSPSSIIASTSPILKSLLAIAKPVFSAFCNL